MVGVDEQDANISAVIAMFGGDQDMANLIARCLVGSAWYLTELSLPKGRIS